jgi:TIR domain-containing protein/tetratricopeptide repeat protein
VVSVYDVFLCYNWDDKQLTDELHAALVARGVRTFQDDKSIPFGDALDPKLRDALLGSRMLVPLITPAFHDSPSCRKELLTALTAAYRMEEGFTERVMPVTWRVRPSALRPRQLKRAKLLAFEGHRVEELAEIIADKVHRIRASDDRRFGDAPRYPDPAWYPVALPSNKRFQGRGELMWDIHESLLVKDKPGNRAHPVVSVRGDGGQGKTALCERYAHLFAEDHPGGVFVIRLDGSDRRRSDGARTMTLLHQQLRQIASRLGPHVHADTTDGLVAVIGNELGARMPYLWLVDDVPSTVGEELLKLLWAPSGNGKTLVTTRGRLGGVLTDEFELGPLDEHDCVRVLTAASGLPRGRSEERTAVAEVAADLGHNALGLTIAAGLTRTAGFTSYQALRDELRRTAPDALELAAHLTDVPLGYRKEFSTTLMRSFAALHDEGRDVLAVTSVLGSAPLPLDLVNEVLARVARPPGGPGFTQMIEHGLAAELGDDTHSVHALIARAARFFFPSEYRRRLRDASADVIGDSLEAARDSFHRTKVLSARLPHMVALVTTSEWPPVQAGLHGLNEAVRAQTDLGDTAGALHSAKVLHRSCAESADVDDETKLQVLVSLGAALFGQGEYTEARRVQEEAVHGLRTLRGQDHADTLQAEENLGILLGKLDLTAESRALLGQVCRRRSVTSGPTARQTLTALNNYVLAVVRDGSPRLGLRLALVAWARWQWTASPNTPGTLDIVEAVGHCLFFLGRRQEAAETYAYVADQRRAELGASHPDTIDAEENAATARQLSQWPVYAERLKVQGPAHVDTLGTLLRLLAMSLRDYRPGAYTALESSAAAPEPLGDLDPRLDGDHAEMLADAVSLAAQLDDQETIHGPDDPRALRAKVLLAHALAAADQMDGQIEVARVIVEDSRDGLEEAAARRPDTVEPTDLDVAEAVHHWVLELMGEHPDY